MRPKTDDEFKKTKTIKLRIDDSTLAMLCDLQELSNCDRSKIIRNLIEKEWNKRWPELFSTTTK